MRVGYVWDADYPWDIRTEKICAFLSGRGHEVTIAARNRAWQPLAETRPEGLVRRMPPWRGLGRSLDALLSFPAFFNPRWISHLEHTVRLARPEVLVVRDLPLGPTTVWVARRHRLPVVIDMAENYPAMIATLWETGRRRAFDVLVRNPAAIARVERWTLPRVSHVLVVVEESRDRLTALGVSAERITIVSNTPPRARADRAEPGRRATGSPLRLVYLGLLEVHRGVGELLAAAAMLRDRGQPVSVTIIGNGRDDALFHQQALELGLGPPMVRFTGRLPNEAALAAVAEADVGVVPHLSNQAWNTTIPNKLFDYMAAGLAVVSSDAAPCRRVVTETGCGRVYRSGDPGDLARAVEELLHEPVRAACGQAGRAAIRSRYNWEEDCARLEHALLSLLPAAPAGRDDG
ncbi:MAG TPA: glycosyltransferase family 4 protein [Gemmatimonadales bacterium]|nr:glycosyltransferase family 4 protein [Gemmatimonadales bacterium]